MNSTVNDFSLNKEDLLTDDQKLSRIDDDSKREDVETLYKARNEIKASREQYERNSAKKWIPFVVLLTLGFVAGFLWHTIDAFVGGSAMQRSGLDAMAEKYYGDTKISEAIPDELLLCAYNFNAR